MIILDTNVLSELLRPSPAPQVEAWLSALDATEVYFTAIGEAELRHGVALMPASKRRAALAEAIDDMLDEDFHGRILPRWPLQIPPLMASQTPPCRTGGL